MMKALGTPNITPELKQTVVDGVMREAAALRRAARSRRK